MSLHVCTHMREYVFCLCVWQVCMWVCVHICVRTMGVCSCAPSVAMFERVESSEMGLSVCLDTGICFTAGVGVIFLRLCSFLRSFKQSRA